MILITCDEESAAEAIRYANARTPYVVYTVKDGEANVAAAVQTPHIGGVVLDTDWGAREVAKMLVGLGHRRIAYVRSTTGRDVLESSFVDELHALGVCPSDVRIWGGGATFADGARALARMMSEPLPPTAVFTRNDELASGLLAEARGLGIRVPADLSVVGHDDVQYAALLSPPLTTVRVDCVHIGTLIVDILLSMLDSPETRPPIRHVRPTLVMRDSVSPPGG